jgi:hypothetical protein
MTFDPIKGVIQITPDEAKRGAAYLLYAIRKVKQSAGLPLTPYKQDGALTDADHAMHGILEAGEAMGLSLAPVRWGNEIDSTQHT